MAANEGSAKWDFIYGLLVGIVVCSILVLCLSHHYSQETNKKGLVACADYQQISDKYQTVDGYHFVVINGQFHNVEPHLFDKAVVGGYARPFYFTAISPVEFFDFQNLTPVNESESGFRGACRVMP